MKELFLHMPDTAHLKRFLCQRINNLAYPFSPRPFSAMIKDTINRVQQI